MEVLRLLRCILWSWCADDWKSENGHLGSHHLLYPCQTRASFWSSLFGVSFFWFPSLSWNYKLSVLFKGLGKEGKQEILLGLQGSSYSLGWSSMCDIHGYSGPEASYRLWQWWLFLPRGGSVPGLWWEPRNMFLYVPVGSLERWGSWRSGGSSIASPEVSHALVIKDLEGSSKLPLDFSTLGPFGSSA